MTPIKERCLFEMFRRTFSRRLQAYTPISKGLCCGDGWYQVIYDMAEKIEIELAIIEDENEGNGSEIGLTICFIILETMVISYCGKRPSLKKYEERKSETDPNVYQLDKKEIGDIFHKVGVKDKEIYKRWRKENSWLIAPEISWNITRSKDWEDGIGREQAEFLRKQRINF